MFKKKVNNEQMTKLKNTIALKRNVYAIILSVIFIAVTIGLITVSTVLAEKYPLDLDLTTNKQHSISDENFEYIRNIDKNINIYVMATEEQYYCRTGTSSDMNYIAAEQYFYDIGLLNIPEAKQYFNVNVDNTSYFAQTVELLKKYQSYNDNIKVTFMDVYDAKARDITSGFSDFDWSAGDILIEGNFAIDGKDTVRRTVVSFDDLYEVKDYSGEIENYKQYGYESMIGYMILQGQLPGYGITENKTETMISSAIYKVTSPDTPVFLVPTAISNKESVADALQKVLEVNNFEIKYSDQILSILLTEENYDKYDGIILSDCKSDISVSDREVIEKFLNNKGKKGKALYYFAGPNTVSLKNLCGLLGDWGIGFEQGVLYETGVGYFMNGQPTYLAMESVATDYTEATEDTGLPCISDNLVVMKELWANQTSSTATYTRTTEVLMRTASKGLTAIMPTDADFKAWKPADDAKKEKYPTAILSRDDDTLNNQFISSFVVVYASADIIAKENNQNSLGNMDNVLGSFNEAVGNTDSQFEFVPKTIEVDYYSTTEISVEIVRAVFLYAIPVIIIVLGVVVWIRRKRR